MTDTNYSEYLASEHWKTTRAGIRRRARGWCERCKVGKRADVHHMTYERLGAEEKSDLIAVCTPCHEFLHGKHSSDPASTKYTAGEVKIIHCFEEMRVEGWHEFIARCCDNHPLEAVAWQKRTNSIGTRQL